MRVVWTVCIVVIATRIDSAEKQLGWKDILQDPMFVRFMTFAANKGKLDVVVSSECFDDNGYALGRFLQRAPFATRLSSHRRGFCTTFNCPDGMHKVVSLLLIMYKLRVREAESLGTRYVNSVVLLSNDLMASGNSVDDGSFFLDNFNSLLLYNGVSTIYANRSEVFLTKDSKTECLSCDQSTLVENRPPRIFRQVSFDGSELGVFCDYPNVCEHPTYRTFLSVLRHKNASVHDIDKDGTKLKRPDRKSVV